MSTATQPSAPAHGGDRGHRGALHPPRHRPPGAVRRADGGGRAGRPQRRLHARPRGRATSRRASPPTAGPSTRSASPPAPPPWSSPCAALGIGPGDEVIVPTYSFIATAEAVSTVGATPVLVDVDPETALITAEIVEPALTARTRCVIPVHLFGRPVEMDPLARPLPPARDRRDRGRLPGPRRPLQRPPGRLARRRRLLQLLPDQEPRRLGRRRRAGDQRRRAGRQGAAAALARRGHPPPPRAGRPAPTASTPCRRRSSRSSCATSTTGTRRRRDAADAPARGAGRHQTSSLPAAAGGRQRPRLPPLRRPLAASATRCATTSTPAASPARSTTRRRSTSSPPTPTSASAGSLARGRAARLRKLLAADLPGDRGLAHRRDRGGGRELWQQPADS